MHRFDWADRKFLWTLQQFWLQKSLDLNSFRFQFAVSLMALKTLALILPVVLAVIPDPDWQAFKNKFQKILGWVCHQHLYHNVQVIVCSSTGTGFVFDWYTAMSLSLSKDSKLIFREIHRPHPKSVKNGSRKPSNMALNIVLSFEFAVNWPGL